VQQQGRWQRVPGGTGRRAPAFPHDPPTAPIGRAPAFTRVLMQAHRVAPTEVNVLLTGETGTGKEVLARIIHGESLRARGPFVSINCGALPEGILEGELFGVRRGAFTGAVADREGLLVAAAGGTFFLDEVGEMPPSLQVRLLRVLQAREVLPVGGRVATPLDVRFIAATHQDLDARVAEGNFREDLFYRLHGVQLHLPPLRARAEDLELLIRHFLQQAGEDRPLTPAAAAALSSYAWPGNIRELEHALAGARALSRGEASIGLQHLPDRVTRPAPPRPVQEVVPTHPTLAALERTYIEWVLAVERGNRTRAARVLGIDPSTLHRKLARPFPDDAS